MQGHAFKLSVVKLYIRGELASTGAGLPESLGNEVVGVSSEFVSRFVSGLHCVGRVVFQGHGGGKWLYASGCPHSKS